MSLLLVPPPLRQNNSRARENVERQELMRSEHQRGSALTLLSAALKPYLVPPHSTPLRYAMGRMEPDQALSITAARGR